MKNLIYLIFISFSLFNLSAQTTIYSESFESLDNTSTGGWTLEVDGTGSGSRNRWSILTGGTGGTGVHAPISGSKTLRVAQSDGTFNYNATNPADIQAIKQVNCTGYKNITLQFKYKCNGEWDVWFGDIYDAGMVGYSLNGTTITWFNTGGLYNDGFYNDVTSTATQNYTFPAPFISPFLIQLIPSDEDSIVK